MRWRCNEAERRVAEFAKFSFGLAPSMMVLAWRVPCVGVAMPVPVTVRVSVGGRIEVDLRGRLPKAAARPAAEEA